MRDVYLHGTSVISEGLRSERAVKKYIYTLMRNAWQNPWTLLLVSWAGEGRRHYRTRPSAVQGRKRRKTSQSACVRKIACGFQLQYTDRTNQLAADSVSEPAPLTDHGCLLWRTGQLHRWIRNPVALCNEASSSPHKLKQTSTQRLRVRSVHRPTAQKSIWL
jgi:hypothetical protein